MKRTGQLFEAICDRENLRHAFAHAIVGKRHQPAVREFADDLEHHLVRLSRELRDGTVQLGRFRQFLIRDPKERVITAPCLEERVIHHAIVNVCEPTFERWLIDDTFACRVGRGRLAALQRARVFSRRYEWFLKLDIRRYFDSVRHDLLERRLSRLFREERLLELLARIVGSFRGDLGCGLPIGSLTSQHFANCFLGDFDRFVKETLRAPGYVRYMDDMVLWGTTRCEARRWLAECEEFLRDRLALAVKPRPFWNRTSQGLDFLGCRVFPHHLTLNRRSRMRFGRKLRAMEAAFCRGEIDENALQRRAESLVAFTRAGGVSSWRFRAAVLARRSVITDDDGGWVW